MDINNIKKIFTTIGAGITALLGALFIPACLLIASNIIDYFTAISAAKKRGKVVDSSIGIAGIQKKVFMWIPIVIGAMFDQLIIYAGEMFGIHTPFNFLVAAIVAVWLVCNEWISVLENLNDLGVNMPPFLMPIVQNLKNQVQDKTHIEEEKTEDERH